MKKPGKTFIRGLVMDGVCASPCAHQFERSSARRRSFASGCGSIRLLRGAIASALPNVIPSISESQMPLCSNPTSENTAPRRDFQAFGKPDFKHNLSESQMPPTDVRDRNERKNPQRVKRSLDSGCGDADLPPLAVRRIPRRRSGKEAGSTNHPGGRRPCESRVSYTLVLKRLCGRFLFDFINKEEIVCKP